MLRDRETANVSASGVRGAFACRGDGAVLLPKNPVSTCRAADYIASTRQSARSPPSSAGVAGRSTRRHPWPSINDSDADLSTATCATAWPQRRWLRQRSAPRPRRRRPTRSASSASSPGQAAESFGIPAVNGAKVLIEAFNAGTAPAPYNKVGFGGLKIEPVYVDENGGATQQVAGAEQPLRPREGRRRRRLRRLGRLPRRRAGRRGDEEVPDPLRLRHAAHLRGRQVRLRLSHRRPRDDGQRRPGAAT